ncbi:MAG: hypothetical protein PHF86_02175 [Candidatus Nanoarchaeia archaeon]|nr:hypothetical protein [Candidatus Nanoarchaeia archaeon]
MTHKQKGLLTVSKEWAVHLRFKRPFWKKERQTSKKLMEKLKNE